ncbi:conserved hypothetical protein [Thermobifida fusca YX]|nr:conserved hypothetical protein [Thermobifida fusca YX]
MPQQIGPRSRPPVHPHVRGEHDRPRFSVPGNKGPSPRAWGASRRKPGRRSGPRSIPTCVGSIRRGRWSSRRSAVHPHVRGEHVGSDNNPDHRRGPSPRAWGAFGTGLSHWCRCPVHPHVRGEHRRRGSRRDRGSGPSPRAWGAYVTITGATNRARSIPTCVGSMMIRMGRPCSSPVHPHVRGEHNSDVYS